MNYQVFIPNFQYNISEKSQKSINWDVYLATSGSRESRGVLKAPIAEAAPFIAILCGSTFTMRDWGLNSEENTPLSGGDGVNAEESGSIPGWSVTLISRVDKTDVLAPGKIYPQFHLLIGVENSGQRLRVHYDIHTVFEIIAKIFFNIDMKNCDPEVLHKFPIYVVHPCALHSSQTVPPIY